MASLLPASANRRSSAISPQLTGELNQLVLRVAIAQVGATTQPVHLGHAQAFAGRNSRGKEKTKVSLAVVTG